MYMVRIVSAMPKDKERLCLEFGDLIWSGIVLSGYENARELVSEAKSVCPAVELEILRRVS